MADPLATTGDVVDVWRPLTDAEVPRIENLIVKASALLRRATRYTIDDRIGLFATTPADPRAVDPVVAATVVATIVKRFLDNPEGAVSESETAGIYSRQVSYGGRGDSEVRGEMAVTDQDLANLSGDSAAQVGSITVGIPPTLQVAGWRHGDCLGRPR